MKMKITYIFSLLAAFIPSLCLACSCRDEIPVLAAVHKSDAVFVGRLTKIDLELRPEGEHFFEIVVCTFTKAEMLKGAHKENKSMTVVTALQSTACGYPFRIGEEYLVYATVRRGELETSTCDRTKPLEKSVTPKDADGSSIEDYVIDDSGKKEAEAIRALMIKSSQASQPVTPRG